MKGGELSGNASSSIGTAAPEAPEKRGERECGSNRHREYFNAFWEGVFRGIAGFLCGGRAVESVGHGSVNIS
jgi:hypothetical protein